MKFLLVNEHLGYAGTSSYSLDLALALREGRHEVRLCTQGGLLRDFFRRKGIETYHVRFNLFSYRQVIEYLREYAPDIIHIQNRRSVGLGRRLSAKLRVPHLVTVHRLPEGPRPKIGHPLLAGVIVTNEVIREYLVNNQGVPKGLIRVIPRGVNVEALAPEVGRQPPGPESGLLPVFGSVGRLSRIKGHDVFIEAARKVLDRGLEAMFTVVGEGDDHSRLWRLVRKLGLERQVTFSPHIPDRRELYRVFDMVVVPTLRGGLGSAVLEAMAMGKPVIASAVGEVLHILQDGKTGLLVPEGDPEALADAMARLITDPRLGDALGRAAREHVVERFPVAAMLSATMAFYQEVFARLGEGRAAP